MLPESTDIEYLNDLTIVEQPSFTYKLRFEDDNRVKGYADEKEAVKQAVYLILATERYKYEIYSGGYGIELSDLFGKDTGYVVAVLPNRIKDALMYDDRIEDVVDFEFEVKKSTVFVKFKVISIYGDEKIDIDWEVEV